MRRFGKGLIRRERRCSGFSGRMRSRKEEWRKNKEEGKELEFLV